MWEKKRAKQCKNKRKKKKKTPKKQRDQIGERVGGDDREGREKEGKTISNKFDKALPTRTPLTMCTRDTWAKIMLKSRTKKSVDNDCNVVDKQ
jgi:hypothetical protein